MSSAYDLPPRTKRIVVIGTLLGLLLAASNQTVISTALPRMVADLGGLNLIPWVFTGYMLTSTTVVPVSGKLSDLYGRKPFFMGGIILFMLVSIAGGFCQNMEQLIVVRAIQGLGGGMLLSSVFAIVGDLFAPEERGRYQGIFISMFGVASILGPTMGGAITDLLTWRGIFYMNLPFGVAALLMVGTTFPQLERDTGKVSIDYPGVALLTSMLICLLLALAWAGDVYAWQSAEIVGLLSASGLLFVAFLFVESRAAEPIVPLHLFRNRVFAVGSLLTFLSGITLTSVITFIPMYLQGVLGASATSSGLVLSPMMIAVAVGSNAGGFLVARTGRYRSFVLAGAAALVAGMFMLTRFEVDTGWAEAIAGMALVGVGIGLAVPVINLAVQNAFPRRYLGIATSSSQFFRSIGSTLGVAIFGTLVVTSIQDNIDRTLPVAVTDAATPQLIEQLHEPDVILSPHGRASLERGFLELDGDGQSLFDSTIQAIESSLTDAVTDVFLIGFLVAVLAFVLSALVPERPRHAELEEMTNSPPRTAPIDVAPRPAD
ncbi:MAG TPA: MDR family MFS transporter [Dehalococcoidia bacterium]|nr:MDR family MFS transporter [Dehalococcoidia bacterium]